MNKNEQITPNSNPIMEDVWFDAFYIDESLGSDIDTKGLLIEGKNIQIGSAHNWYRIDPPNGEPRPGNLRHMHGYVEKRGHLIQIFAICDDGSGHDGCHQTRIPKEFVSILQAKGFVLPKDNLIETYVVPRYVIGYEQQTKTTMMIDSNIQIGNIYIMHLPMDAPFPFACVKVVAVDKDIINNDNVVCDIDIAGSVSRETIDALRFRLMCIPFKIHHMLLERLTFAYEENVYFIVMDDLSGRTLYIKCVGDCYDIDKEMNGIKNQIVNTKFNSLDGLLNLCRQLFNLTFNIKIEGFTHILILIKDVEEYLKRLIHYIKQNGYCLSSRVPDLFTISNNIPMSRNDCDLILSYAKAIGLIKEVIIDMEYLAYELCE